MIKMSHEHASYFKIALKSIAWSGLLKVLMRVLTFVRIAVLARILTPAQFGIFGIATLALALIEILTETGINVFLIQQNESIKKYLNTAYIISIARGVIIALIILISSPLIASFFNSPSSLTILMLTSIIPFIRGFINPAIVTYQKELRFNNEFYFRFSIFLFETVVVLFIATTTRSEISLVIGLIVSAIIEVIFSFILIPLKPKLRFSKGVFTNIMQRGKWVTSAGIVNYLFQNADDVIVGKLLGASSLGLYQMAYKIAILPITEISDVVAKVAFPIYVKIADDQVRLRKAFIKSFALISGLSIVLGAFSLIFIHQIVAILLGEKWLEILPFLRILIIFGVVRAITGTPSMLFLAVKKQEYITHFTGSSFIVMMILIVPFLNMRGLIGVGEAVLISALIAVPLTAYYTYKILFK